MPPKQNSDTPDIQTAGKAFVSALAMDGDYDAVLVDSDDEGEGWVVEVTKVTYPPHSDYDFTRYPPCVQKVLYHKLASV